MPRTIQLTKSAEKEFRRLPRRIQERFATAFDALAGTPTRARPGLDVRRLHGTRTAWRLRAGDHRGIYDVEDATVVFTRFGSRSKVYEV